MLNYCGEFQLICWFVNEGQLFCTTEGVKESTQSLYINSSVGVLVYGAGCIAQEY